MILIQSIKDSNIEIKYKNLLKIIKFTKKKNLVQIQNKNLIKIKTCPKVKLFDKFIQIIKMMLSSKKIEVFVNHGQIIFHQSLKLNLKKNIKNLL